MRPYFLILICHLSANTYAQNPDTGYYKLIYSNIRSIQDSGMVFYSDKPAKEVYASFLNRIPSALETLKERGIDLKKRELDTLVRILKVMANDLQPAGLFPMSTRISSDIIISYVENIVRRSSDSLRQLPYNALTSNNFWRLPWAFFFTHPIYLRGGTLCFGYFMYYRNSGGEHGLNVYKVYNKEFVRVGTIGGGAW